MTTIRSTIGRHGPWRSTYVLATLVVAACGQLPQPGASPVADARDLAGSEQQVDGVDARFDCDGGLQVHAVFVGPETLRLRLPDGDHILQGERAASGARYSGEGIVFWNKGDEALLDIGGVAHHCGRSPAASAADEITTK